MKESGSLDLGSIPNGASSFEFTINNVQLTVVDFCQKPYSTKKLFIIVNCQLYIVLGVPASRRAFRYIFAHFVITPLAKDAASIPNALGKKNKLYLESSD